LQPEQESAQSVVCTWGIYFLVRYTLYVTGLHFVKFFRKWVMRFCRILSSAPWSSKLWRRMVLWCIPTFQIHLTPSNLN